MKGVQCYELFRGIALKNHTFSFFISFVLLDMNCFASNEFDWSLVVTVLQIPDRLPPMYYHYLTVSSVNMSLVFVMSF